MPPLLALFALFCCSIASVKSDASAVSRPFGLTSGVESSLVAVKDANSIRIPIITRGGGATKKTQQPCDSNSIIAVKTVVSVALETAGLLGAIKLGEVASTKIKLPDISGLPLFQWLSLVFVIFSSSTIKSWVSGGVLGAATNQLLKPNVVPGDGRWYASLKKPWFNPPGWVFPIMWLIVSKPTQLIAVSKVMSSKENNCCWPALAVYCAHLSLGDAWNDVFFGCQRIGLGILVICTFFGFLLTSAKLFSDINPQAGKFMLPTCGWVSIATALNIAIYILNPTINPVVSIKKESNKRRK